MNNKFEEKSLEQSSNLPDLPDFSPEEQKLIQKIKDASKQQRKGAKINPLSLYFLLKAGLNQSQCARVFGCTKQSVSEAVQKYEIDIVQDEIFQKNQIYFLIERYRKILDFHLSDDAIKNMDSKEAKFWADHLKYWGRIEEGKATEISRHEVQDTSKMSMPELVQHFNLLIRELNIYPKK